MNPKMAHIASLYKVTQGLFDKAVKQVKPADIPVRPQDIANSFLFVAGHIAAHRYTVAALLGIKDDWAPKELFGIGADLKEASAYPSLAEIKQAFDVISVKINARLAEVTEVELSGAPPFRIPNVEESIGGIVAFLSMHESYHIGQLAYILRLHGGDRLVG